MKILFILICVYLISSCSMLYSTIDQTYFLWATGDDINKVKTPNKFLVTPKQIVSLIPITKIGHKVYYDNQYYYITPSINLFYLNSPSKNSYSAKHNSTKISGLKIDEFENFKAKQTEELLSLKEAIKKSRLNKDLYRELLESD